MKTLPTVPVKPPRHRSFFRRIRRRMEAEKLRRKILFLRKSNELLAGYMKGMGSGLNVAVDAHGKMVAPTKGTYLWILRQRISRWLLRQFLPPILRHSIRSWLKNVAKRF